MRLSLATWSLVSLLRGQRPLDYLDVPTLVRERFGIDALELNSPFFASREPGYLLKLRSAAQQAGVRLLNIAVDEQGDLSSPDAETRELGVSRYGAWIGIAAEMGINAIRANSGGKAVAEAGGDDPARRTAEQACIDSLRRLCDLGQRHGVAVLVENHWGLSADPQSLARVVGAVRQSHGAGAVGTLVDWGNWPDRVDRFDAMRIVFPYAMAVHAKVMAIDEALDHPAFDLARCVALTREAGYDGFLGIEYEGGGDALAGIDRGVRKLRPLL
jgi:sugar phosphate isomerase/epimerase